MRFAGMCWPDMRRLALCWVALGTACGDVEEIHDVSYDDRHGSATTMDVYLPPAGGVDRPGVLLIHGGGWHTFSKDVYGDHGRRLAEAGFVVAAINYRLVPDGAYPAMVRDCLCALAFFRSRAEEYGLDPDRVAVAGYSAGGHLASLIGVAAESSAFAPGCSAGSTPPPRAVVSGAGPQDMRRMPQVDVVVEFMGGTIEEVPARYDVASPIWHVSGDEPPFLFLHGTDDAFVDIRHSEDMRRALLDVGGHARLLRLQGGGHILNPSTSLGRTGGVIAATDTPEAWAATIAFLDEHLGTP